MTASLGTATGNSAQPMPPIAPRSPIPGRRSYSTPLQAVRRRQEALERLAARPVMPPRRVEPIAVITSPRPEPRTLPVPLTTREVEVLRTWLLVDSKADVASRLNISVGTVNTHLARIRTKYADAGRAARTKASLVARAIQDGLVTLEEL
ncbi:LuxR C-terminal-related transcriptional regulator [Gordonia sp. NB41Y]|uniref:LuxR C-terminal-related transcriptional regulator n=1 Tax=Gordonia sp. NB41Y TaxID=875808 RepID=UPI0006B18245|nr:LuxR C-terminal-related transcriptional regulator [Gordonia sp. NB41Y]KOY49349.1 LuxR family transcriptional regulator [Gordonia sp. NB41Y]WLP90442.1 LuxR C-terminal-related transcriptional regulator [Gordonia sp. NB41Y]